MKIGFSRFKKPNNTGHVKDTGSAVSVGIDVPGTHMQLTMRGIQNTE